ncbi:MAG: hypothetical protein M3466_17015 [Gemmatimonadota bacterium]|nr:hypothetical protein [Gemmatimonadota bacterium]
MACSSAAANKAVRYTPVCFDSSQQTLRKLAAGWERTTAQPQLVPPETRRRTTQSGDAGGSSLLALIVVEIVDNPLSRRGPQFAAVAQLGDQVGIPHRLAAEAGWGHAPQSQVAFNS